jgi:hypothetical protein
MAELGDGGRTREGGGRGEGRGTRAAMGWRQRRPLSERGIREEMDVWGGDPYGSRAHSRDGGGNFSGELSPAEERSSFLASLGPG